VVPVPFDRRGGLVDLRIEYSDLAPELRRPWREMGARLVNVITYVEPAIAAVDQDLAPELLPVMTWTDARTLLAVGWVREGTLTPEQQLAFEALRRRRLVRRHGGGLVWGSGPMWSLTNGILRGDGEDVTAAVFEAWTGTPASPRTPAPDPLAGMVFESNPFLPEAEVDQEELNRHNPPELWFWHHALDEEDLLCRVATALPQYEVQYDEDESERWRAVVAYPPAGRTDQESLLQDLRKAVVTVEPDWAALQPRGGVAVPGLDMELPASGILDHPWVHRQWIGNRLPELEWALEPVAPEPVGNGLLFVTTGDPRNPGAGHGAFPTSAARFAAVVETARILGEVAVDAVDPL
jgi:hypothetical protein